MAQTLKESLTITSGLGVNVNNSGVECDASSPMTQIIDVGNDVSITGNVQFNQLTASLYSFGNDISITNSGHFLGNPTYTGPTSITTTLSIGGNSTITGKSPIRSTMLVTIIGKTLILKYKSALNLPSSIYFSIF